MLRVFWSISIAVGFTHAARCAWAAESTTKTSICTITINSSDEAKIFRQKLGDQDFEFHELVPPFESNHAVDWFDVACKSGVKCDVLSISGHFGDGFFGETGLTLSADQLQERRCRSDCEGILGRPVEVFLFGCNTLAGERPLALPKEEAIRQVMRETKQSRRAAKKIVEARMSGIGTDVRSTMRRVFRNARRIYGFDFIAPAGNSVKPMLESYFKKIPNYSKHLELLSSTELENKSLKDALQETTLDQCSGIAIGKNERSDALQKKICEFYRPELTQEDLLKLIDARLRDEDRAHFIPVVMKFLNKVRSQGGEILNGEAMARIKRNKDAKKTLRRRLELVTSPTQKAAWLELGEWTGWIDERTLREEAREVIFELLEGLNDQKAGQICQLPSRVSELALLKNEEVPDRLFTTKIGVRVLKCLNFSLKDQKLLGRIPHALLKLDVAKNPVMSEKLIDEMRFYLPHWTEDAPAFDAALLRFRELDGAVAPDAEAKVVGRVRRARVALELERARRARWAEAETSDFLSLLNTRNPHAMTENVRAITRYLDGHYRDVETVLLNSWKNPKMNAIQRATLMDALLQADTASGPMKSWAQSEYDRLSAASSPLAERFRVFLDRFRK